MPTATNFNDGAPEYEIWKPTEIKEFNNYWGSSAQKQKAAENAAAWDAMDPRQARLIRKQRRAINKKSGRYGPVGSNHMSTKNKPNPGGYKPRGFRGGAAKAVRQNGQSDATSSSPKQYAGGSPTSRRERLLSGEHRDIAQNVLNDDGYLNADGTGADGKRINWAKIGRPDFASGMSPGYKSSYAPGQSPYDLQKARAGRRVKERQERKKNRMAGDVFKK